jgi:MFS family permease
VAPLDVIGFFLSAIAASGVVFGLSVVSLPALPPWVGAMAVLLGIASGFAYWRHSRGQAHPVLDLGLFRTKVFRIAISGSALYRIGAGATPFLLPLFFQLSFGLTPFEAGMLTFATAFGALAMKFLAPVTLRAGGFRNVLLWAAVLSGASIAASALFTAETPHGMIIAMLMLAGFLRSMFFTSTNALIFADIEEREAGQATAIATATQQITSAIGVAVGGGILEGMHHFTGEPIGHSTFATAFIVVGTISALAALPFLALPRDAGSSVSGHRLRGPANEEPPAE